MRFDGARPSSRHGWTAPISGTEALAAPSRPLEHDSVEAEMNEPGKQRETVDEAAKRFFRELESRFEQERPDRWPAAPLEPESSDHDSEQSATSQGRHDHGTGIEATVGEAAA